MSGRPQGPHIEVSGLTKRYGAVRAVDDLSFTVRPGVVTGFLGPNGAGKSTTMRMILGLVAPTSGTATIGGRRYVDLPRPSATVGAVLDASAVHPGHSARDHLHIYRTMGGHPADRVDELLTRLGLAEVADRPTRTFSTGMRQRLSLATALLGDPRVLLLDEPGNGLDPEGIAWLRALLRGLAAEGRTVLISSHVLSEVQQIVEDVVVIRKGRAGGSGTTGGDRAVVAGHGAGPLPGRGGAARRAAARHRAGRGGGPGGPHGGRKPARVRDGGSRRRRSGRRRTAAGPRADRR